MTDPLSPQLHAALQIVYAAYDRVYDIASHRWHATAYYDHETKQSSLLGHYVRSLPRYRDHDPAYITEQQYEEAAQPLVDAINLAHDYTVVSYRYRTDIRRICAETGEYYFPQTTTYERCMIVFRRIEEMFPRADYRDAPFRKKKKSAPRIKARTQTYSIHSRPHRTIKWHPYKD